MIERLPRLVARVPATVHAKLLASFLVISSLLVVMGVVSVQVLDQANRRLEDLVMLQKKLAAYRQLQSDANEQLYSVTSALLVSDDQTREAALRHMRQFGYDFERLRFVAQDEVELLAQVEADYTKFTQLATQVTDLIRSGKLAEGRSLESAQAGPLADHLQSRTNRLVNKAEAEMLTRVSASREASMYSQVLIIVFAAASVALALVLGYAISWSVIGPVKQMEERLREIAAGDFLGTVDVPNRDELGDLAANLNQMNGEIAAQSRQLAEWNGTLEMRVQQQVEEIQRARERLVTAREEERRRLRRDLHDGLGPTMASLFQRLDTALTLMAGDREAAMRLLVDLKIQVRNAIVDIRRVVYGLRPPTLDEFGLIGAIREHAARLTEAHGLRLTLEVPDFLPPLPAAVEVAAYHIALEGLTNVMRHAHANACCLKLSLSDAIYVEMDDDGVGMASPSHPGVGISSMHERTAELGGDLRMGRSPAGGMHLWARLPLSQSAG